MLRTECPFEWSCDCDPGRIEVTVRIYDNSNVTPGTYKWEYEFHNVSFDPQESVGPRGLDSWSLAPAWGPLNTLSNLTPPSPLWGFWVEGGSYLQAALDPESFGFMPGQTLHFSFVAGSQYPPFEDWGGAGKWILTGLDDGEGPPGCESWYGMLYLNIGGPVLVPGKSPMRLKELGWPTESSRQPFWVTSTFASNGDPALGDRRTEALVYDDPLGDGHHRINDPVAFKHGWQGVANAVLFVDPVWNDGSVSIKLEVDPPDFAFAPVDVTPTNGLVTLPSVTMTSPFPDHVLNKTYAFNWSLWFDGEPQETLSTSHKVHLMHHTVTLFENPQKGDYNVTSKRLDHVTFVANGKNGLAAIAGQIQAEHEDQLNGTVKIGENAWAWFENPHQVDCESLAAISAAELQQVGFGTAIPKRAYPTGAEPEGDTNATTQESKTESSGVYSLVYTGDNFFEGFVEVMPPSSSEPVALTIAPDSPLLYRTGCTVSPNDNDNRLRFRVLTHVLNPVPAPRYQQFRWDDMAFANGGKSPPQDLYLPGLHPFPMVNCPASEGGDQ